MPLCFNSSVLLSASYLRREEGALAHLLGHEEGAMANILGQKEGALAYLLGLNHQPKHFVRSPLFEPKALALQGPPF